ncbi:MAG: low temperature requirement protein A [Planctomycetota bacterium]
MTRHLRAMRARDRDEHHRAATPLELFFDLVVVVAIAAAAHGLRHEVAHGHAAQGIVLFLMAFFAVWWPWNLFTWFGSAFDNDDAGYRVNVMALMFGAMCVAAAVPGFFAERTLGWVWGGYVIMRTASVVLWLRAGRANPGFRRTAARYAVGQVIVQTLWALLVFGTDPDSTLFFAGFAGGVALELLVPWYAEHATPTSWHRHHVIERFGLLNIIVLGEVLLACTQAMEPAIAHGLHGSMLVVPLGGAAIALSMWWLYFAEPDHLRTVELRHAFLWAYGHFLVFAAGAAAGAGLGAMVDVAAAAHGEGHADAHGSAIGLAVSIPVGLYVAGLWLVRDRCALSATEGSVQLVFAVALAASGLLPDEPVPAPLPTAALLVTCLVVRLRRRGA